ncbi:MAG: sodium:calcium antiporter, partial [Acidimicrobiia bacterium]|nr:sodium:calcium antiporter [Acidimicrobiia bacterium]
VGFGTSAPEMLVSALAVVNDETAVAIGNVVGSNLANLSLLLGIGAILVPLTVESSAVRREAPIVVGATALFGLAVQGGIARWEGVALLAAMAASLFVVTRRSGSNADPVEDQIGLDVTDLAQASEDEFSREAFRTVIGLIGTVASAQLLLWAALRLADETGLSNGFVGVTLVAIGTSLPELVTVIQSARRRETDLIVGNLLGSNLFNALAVGGLIGLIGGPVIDDRALTVVGTGAALAVAAIALVAMITGHTVNRLEGVGLIALYAATIPLLT